VFVHAEIILVGLPTEVEAGDVVVVVVEVDLHDKVGDRQVLDVGAAALDEIRVDGVGVGRLADVARCPEFPDAGPVRY